MKRIRVPAYMLNRLSGMTKPKRPMVKVHNPDSILRDISARKYDDDMMSYETSLDRLINLHPNSFLCFDASTCSDGNTEICNAFDAFVIDKGINRDDYEFIWEGGYVATYYFIKKTDKYCSAGLIYPYDYVETNMGDYESLDNEHNYYIRVQLDPINRKLRHYYTKK